MQRFIPLKQLMYSGLFAVLALASSAVHAASETNAVPVQAKIIVDTDHEFDAGSHIMLDALTTTQIEDLATLAKVWGFLKYHHPLVASGQRHWDYDLFRIMPAILGAADHATANLALHHWITNLGEVPECKDCAKLPQNDIYVLPEIEWIDDRSVLGADLSADLQKIYRNRSPSGKQFYVALAPGVRNPIFEHELPYKEIQFPDSGFQLLALFRFWNIVEYWAPYRDQIGENWDNVLSQSIGKIALAKDGSSNQLELIALIARIHDTHANLWSSLSARPPVGVCRLPVVLRFIGNDAVVTGFSGVEAGMATDFKLGDVIEAIDGAPVSRLVEQWRPYYAASNDPTKLRDIAQNMTRGKCGETKLRVRRVSQELELLTTRLPSKDAPQSSTHDRPGDTFQRFSDDVAYIKLSSIKSVDIPRYIESAIGTKGMIIDIRNYPSEFVVFKLGQHFIESPTNFVRFTFGDLANPGAFHWSQNLTMPPGSPYYPGKVVILVDESTQSQAEYTTMAFRAVSKAIVIGSTTAGADGNLSRIPLPGGLQTAISGIGVFYPDKRPTQRIGIVPDIEVKPTVAGIRAGRDELLEAAIAEIKKK